MNVTIDEIFGEIKKDAHKRREDAGYAGSYSDNGARQLERDMEMFQLGMKFAKDSVIPEEWKKYELQIIKDKDPDFEKFKELANKFGYKI